MASLVNLEKLFCTCDKHASTRTLFQQGGRNKNNLSHSLSSLCLSQNLAFLPRKISGSNSHEEGVRLIYSQMEHEHGVVHASSQQQMSEVDQFSKVSSPPDQKRQFKRFSRTYKLNKLKQWTITTLTSCQ